MVWRIVAGSWIGGVATCRVKDAWLARLTDGMAVFVGLQLVVYCGQRAFAHACLSAIA